MKPIAVIDLETDPFEFGKMIYPFLGGYYDGSHFKPFWSENCVQQMVDWLLKLPTGQIIYAHNGGRFDFFYFLKHIEKSLRIVNNRIIQAFLGKHELRDSFAIMPFPLETYRKTEIDYNKFKRPVREKHKQEIIAYLKDDCVDLHTLCVAFHNEFSDNLTIGSAALKQLRKFHKFDSGNGEYDGKLRTQFYFGGRNQCFKTGVIDTPVKIYDVNSMYPHVMDSFLHPVSTGIYRKSTKITDETAFVICKGTNFGAFPIRQDDNSLDFTQTRGTFYTTIHEFLASQDTKMFRCDKIIETLAFKRRESFSDFVHHFYNARAVAKQNNDKIRTIFYKFVLNSAYGKFAQNPENYAEWYITELGELPPQFHKCKPSCDPECRQLWTPAFMCDDYLIWSRPLIELRYYNVATGASITGAARAVLMRGIAKARNPLYCDTDSIICSSLDAEISESKLGAWKLESEGTRAAICGKKLYAIYDSSGVCIKKAHKGAKLNGDQILSIARGAEVISRNEVPAFKFDGSYSFTERLIRATGQR